MDDLVNAAQQNDLEGPRRLLDLEKKENPLLPSPRLVQEKNRQPQCAAPQQQRRVITIYKLWI